MKPEYDPGPLGEQVAATVGDLPQLGDGGVDVERFPARVAGRGAGDLCLDDPVTVRLAAGGGHPWTVPRIEQAF
jgi:hypothetical protein